LSHQRGKKQKNKTNKQKTKQNKNPKLKCNTVSVSPSASSSSSVIVSSKEEKKRRKKESGDSFVNVCLRLQLTCPATVSQLLLEASLIPDLRNKLNSHLTLQALFI
jgi:hypothetical protein